MRGFFVGTVAVVSTSILLTGWSGAKSYLLCLRTLGATMSLHPEAAQSHFGMLASGEPNLHGLLSHMFASGQRSTAVTLTLSAALMWVTKRKVNNLFSAVPTAMLVSYHMQPYDLLLLLAPMTILVPNVLARGNQSKMVLKGTFYVSLVILTVPVGAIMLLHGLTVWFVLAVCGIALASTLASSKADPELCSIRTAP